MGRGPRMGRHELEAGLVQDLKGLKLGSLLEIPELS